MFTVTRFAGWPVIRYKKQDKNIGQAFCLSMYHSLSPGGRGLG